MKKNVWLATIFMSALFFNSTYAFHAGDLVSYNSPSEGTTVGVIEKILSEKQVIVRQALHGSRKGSKIFDGSGNRLFGIDIASVQSLESASATKLTQVKFRTHTRGSGSFKEAYVLESYNSILLTTESEKCVTLFNSDKITYFNEMNDCNNRVVSKRNLIQ